MHVFHEKVVELRGRLELVACVPGSDERAFDDLLAEHRGFSSKVGARFRGEGGILGEESAPQRLLVG
jgi:hypothetical protein